MTINVLISILNYNGSEDTISCLSKLDDMRLNNIIYDVILIDNGSSDIEKKILENYIVGTRKYRLFNSQSIDINVGENTPSRNLYLNLSENFGFSGGHNISFKFAKNSGQYEYVWLLNNDSFPDEKALQRLVKFSENHKPCISGSVIMEYDQTDVIQDLGTKVITSIKGYKATTIDDSKDGNSILVHAVCGASMLVDIAIINRDIIFDENFFLYVEENELGYRCAKLGINSYIVLNSRIFHKGSAGLGKESAIKRYYLVRNLLYLKRKHFSTLSVAFSLLHLGVMTIVKSRDKTSNVNAYICAVYDFFKGNMGKTTRSLDE
jgi:GT2 family glycosyltransferase